MNTRPLEIIRQTEDTSSEMDVLMQQGFTTDEIISLLWLRQSYQTGGSDRMEIVRHLEFLKVLVESGKLER
jgi:hypothetical protein